MAIFTAIGTAIGAISTFIGGLGAIGSFVLKAAVGIGMNLLAQAIAGKPKDPTFSINGTLRGGGDISRSFIVGRAMTAGSLVWANTWGTDGDTPNAYLTQVIALSDLPLASLEEVWVNGEKVTLTGGGSRGQAVTQYRRDGYDYLWVKFLDGTQTGADSFLTGTASNSQRQWPSSRVGRGVAYVIVTARVTKNLFSGIPSFKFVVNGRPLYDPSRDSSVGGSGSQRWDNPATWGGTGDHLPAVQIYNLLRGIYYGGEWFYGMQRLPAARLPAANWIEQINKCRAETPDIYRAGGEIPVEAPLATTLEALLTACQGRITEVGGVYSLFLGAPDAPVASFNDGHILSSEEQSFTPFFGLADTINGIAATYPSPNDGWTMKAAKPLYRPNLETLAGNRRLMADVSLDFVPYPQQVQRLMKSALQEGQRARRHTFVLPPEFWPYAVPGLVLSWTSERNGYVTKQFRIDGAVDRGNLDVMIDITEVDPSDYDWNEEVDYDEPVDGAIGPIRPTPQPIVDWSAAPDSVKDNDGKNRRPAIRLTWDNTEGRLDDVIGVEFEVRLAGTTDVVYRGRTDQPEAGSLLISQGLLPLTQYEVRGRYIPGGDRETLWSGWLLVITPDIRITDIEMELASLSRDTRAVLERIFATMDEYAARLEQLALAGAEEAGTTTQLAAVTQRFRNATAAALREMSATVTEVDGKVAAQAAIVDAVQVVIGDVQSGVLWRISTEAGSGDVVARVVLQMRVEVGDAWTTAGTLWEAGFTGGDPTKPFSRMVVNTEQFLIADATGTVRALFGPDGLTIENVRLGTLLFDLLQSHDGKLRISGGSGGTFIEVRR